MSAATRMVTALVVWLMIAALGAASAQEPSVPDQDVGRFDTTQNRYLPRRGVKIVYRNTTDQEQRLTSAWTVRDGDGRAIARLYWEDHLKAVAPGGARAWKWPQDFNSCGSDGVCTDVGGHVDPGKYRFVARISGVKKVARFRIGRYFTMKFDCDDTGAVPSDQRAMACAELPDPLTFFTSTQRTIRRLRKDLEKPWSERRVIRGRTGREVGYNPNWSFSLKPGSVRVITDGEDCDASVYTVEDKPSKWRGRLWCDTSGYVAREGR